MLILPCWTWFQLGSTVARQKHDFDSDVLQKSDTSGAKKHWISGFHFKYGAIFESTVQFLQGSWKRRVELQQKNYFSFGRWRIRLLPMFILVALFISWEKAVAIWSCRRLPRNNGWFDHVWNTFSDIWIKKTFRFIVLKTYSLLHWAYSVGQHSLNSARQKYDIWITACRATGM